MVKELYHLAGSAHQLPPGLWRPFAHPHDPAAATAVAPSPPSDVAATIPTTTPPPSAAALRRRRKQIRHNRSSRPVAHHLTTVRVAAIATPSNASAPYLHAATVVVNISINNIIRTKVRCPHVSDHITAALSAAVATIRNCCTVRLFPRTAAVIEIDVCSGADAAVAVAAADQQQWHFGVSRYCTGSNKISISSKTSNNAINEHHQRPHQTHQALPLHHHPCYGYGKLPCGHDDSATVPARQFTTQRSASYGQAPSSAALFLS